MIYRFLLLSLCFFFSRNVIAQDDYVDFELKNSYPAAGEKISTLNRIDLDFDLSVYSLSDEDAAKAGIYGYFERGDIKIYKGESASGELMFSFPDEGYLSFDWMSGVTSYSIPLDKEYNLEEGQSYTITIPQYAFGAMVDGSNWDTLLGGNSEISITFYGGEEEPKNSISLKKSIPESGSDVKKLGILTLNFDKGIAVSDDATATLYDGSEIIKSSSISVSAGDAMAAIANFGDEKLKAGHTYTVNIPSEAIMTADKSATLTMPINLTFTGYELFGYKYVSPDSGTVCSKIGTVTIVPEWPEGAEGFVNYSKEYYDKDMGPWAFYVNLYQGVDSTGVLVQTKKMELNNTGTALEVRLNNPELEPNTNYALVIPEGLIPVWEQITSGGAYTPLKGYHSAPLTLVYTGANTASKWSVKDNDQLEKLGLVSLMTGGEATVNEGAKMALYCGEDSIAVADLNASGTFCYADFGDLALEQDSVYSLVIPDSAIVNMPKTTQKFKGIAKSAEYAKVSYKSNGITVASEQVLKGSAVKVDIAMPDSIQLDSLMLNGEKVALADSVYAIDSLAADAEIEAALTYIPKPAPETKFYAVEYTVKSVVGSEEKELSSTSTMVAEDSVFTFKAKAVDENWSVEVSAGEMSEDSIYSVVVAKDTTIAVTCTFNGDVKYVDETASGVYTFENSQDITISTTQGKIVVEGAKAGDTINLYGLNGAKLGQWIVKQDKQTIDVNSGVYLVVVKGDAGKAAAKVSVK